MLGSNIGSVHKQRQGTGYATILQSDNLALKDFLLQDDREQAAKAAAGAAKAKAAQDAMKGLTDFNPERWLKHDKAIQSRMDEWVSKGAQIISAGGNPNNGMDPASIEWRRNKAEIEAASKASMQMKDMYTATRGKIDGSENDKYDPESLMQMQQYFDLPIDRVVKEGILPPPLLQAKPSLNLQKTWTSLSKDLYDAKKDKPITDTEKWDFVRASMANDPGVSEAAASYLHNLPKAERDRYAEMEKKTGRSQIELVNYDFMTRYEPGKEPFDLNTYIQKGVDAIDVPYAEYTTPDKFGKYVKKDEFKKSATEKAQLMLTDPQATVEYQKILPMNPGETEGVYRARAVADLSKRMMDMKAKDTRSGITDKGEGAKKQQVSAEEWLRDIKSGDKDKQARSANFLFESKGVLGNMNITQAEVLDDFATQTLNAADDAPMAGTKYLRLTLEGAPSLQKIEEQVVEAGYSKKDIKFETMGTNSTLILPVNDNTENALLRLHDKAYKTGERAYDPTPQTWSADTILKGAAAPAPNKVKSQF
jgi:hypothetical protein